MGLNPKSSEQSNTNRKERRAKRTFFDGLQALIRKIFSVLKALAKLAWLIIENASQLTVFCFSLLVKLLSSPTTPCLVAIVSFGAVCTVAASQWYAIGVWLGRLLGLSGIWGIGAGGLGVLLGTGLNIYQLAPQLWKLRRDIAEAYKTLGINPEHETESHENVGERLQNWLSMDHGTLKGIRLATYAIETGLVVTYAFLATGLNFFAIVQAAISLILPEKCLELVSSTVAVLGAVSDKVNSPEEDHAQI
ncbi:hypothetical protein NIES2100_73760 [Calothrix sp. NIES-2100]|uniref:hypothetical protein n=1 Tax=Calothrix sp. NIES-2100 TaxID=1954172 RepID=UPI000B619407|nr:hypothetical protein NIES2100_73760 [Calothrix sp. NIES-2100]